MAVEKQYFIQFTKKVLDGYYNNVNIDFVYNIFSENCIFISDEYGMLEGLEQIRGNIERAIVIKSRLDFVNFKVRNFDDDSKVIVYGEYTVIAEYSDQEIEKVKKQLTMCFRLVDNSYKITYVHVSKVDKKYMNVAEDSSEFVCKKIFTDGRNIILVLKDNSKVSININKIIYIEAVNKSSLLHTVEKNITINCSMKFIEDLFIDCLCRIHRSYIINWNYVERIQRFSMTLTNRVVLPIPEKKYAEIKEQYYFSSSKKIIQI